MVIKSFLMKMPEYCDSNEQQVERKKTEKTQIPDLYNVESSSNSDVDLHCSRPGENIKRRFSHRDTESILENDSWETTSEGDEVSELYDILPNIVDILKQNGHFSFV